MADSAPKPAHLSPHGARAREPNPLLVRELRQALRVPRMPWTLAATVAVVGLGMLSFGSMEWTSDHPHPARLGASLFQGFSIILFLYVALVGPAGAAGAIASEREGKTLEPLLLTSLSPRDIARGKFLAAYGTLGLQVSAMIPLAAIPMLFGGVSASELVVTCIYVAAVGANAIAFGLATASRAQTLRNALAVSILLPTTGALPVFSIMTVIGETVAHERWPYLARGPLWWASAYSMVPFGLDYVLFFILWPLALLGLPLALYLALTSANLSAPNDDRSSGLKRWVVVAALSIGALVFLTCFRVSIDLAGPIAFGAVVCAQIAAIIVSALLIAEPLAASRRVRTRWDLERRGALTRFLGPGLMRGAALQVLALASVLAFAFAGAVLGSAAGGLRAKIGIASTAASRVSIASAILIAVAYVQMFSLFVVGLGAYLRARVATEAHVVAARAWMIAGVVIAFIVPGVGWAIVTALTDGGASAELVAAPSPAFAIYAFANELRSADDAARTTVFAFGASLMWGSAGIALLASAADKARKVLASQAKIARKTDEKLKLEDEEEDDDEGATGDAT